MKIRVIEYLQNTSKCSYAGKLMPTEQQRKFMQIAHVFLIKTRRQIKVKNKTVQVLAPACLETL